MQFEREKRFERIMTTIYLLGGALLLVYGLVGCAGPTDPCADADYIVETPMYTAAGDSIVAVAQICVSGPITVQ